MNMSYRSTQNSLLKKHHDHRYLKLGGLGSTPWGLLLSGWLLGSGLLLSLEILGDTDRITRGGLVLA